jgi:rSAM/selenodomain-associated transferase 1
LDRCASSAECLLFFVKWPEPGKVKTRLAINCGDDNAVGLYRCFILDMLDALAQNPQPVCICYSPEEALPDFKSWLKEKYMYLPQRGNDLGERMRHSFQDAFRLGFDSVCLTGSDLPDLPAEYVREAFEHLAAYESVIGPSVEGGYYLMGFRKETFFSGIFDGINWSQSTVYRETIRKYEERGTKFIALPPWNDIDDLQGLKEWYRKNRNFKTHSARTMTYLNGIEKLL